MIMAAVVMFSCTEKEPIDEVNPDDKPTPENPTPEKPDSDKPEPEPEKIYVSFTDNSYTKGAQKTLVMSVLETVNIPVEVEISAESKEDLGLSVVADEDYVEEYNALDVKNYVALPADLYTIADEAVVEGLKAKFNVALDVKKIMAYAEANGKTMEEMSNYVVALKLVAEKAEIATEDEMSLGYYVIVPQVIDAYIQTSLTPVDGLNYEFKVSVPFTNDACTITWDIEFVKDALGTEPSTEKGNYFPAKYQQSAAPAVTNAEVKKMDPETSEVVYTITFPSYQVLGTTINVSNAKIDGIDVPVKDAAENGVKSEVINLAPYQERYKTAAWTKSYGADLHADEGDGVTSEVALFGHSLEKVGLTCMDHTGFIFNPVSSCEYGNAEMTLNVFDGKLSTDWGTMWQASGGGQGSKAWGWDYLKNYNTEYIVSWALIDMGSKKAVEGIEYWRKANKKDQCYDVNTMEIYALDKCTYTYKSSELSYEAADMTYLGTVEFDGAARKEVNVLAAKFERIETQYILIAYRPDNTRANNAAGVHAHEIKFFN